VKNADQSDAQPRSQACNAKQFAEIAPQSRRNQVQFHLNRTATHPAELHLIAPNCTKLHQIAVKK
jgi:hypothetical protein